MDRVSCWKSATDGVATVDEWSALIKHNALGPSDVRKALMNAAQQFSRQHSGPRRVRAPRRRQEFLLWP